WSSDVCSSDLIGRPGHFRDLLAAAVLDGGDELKLHRFTCGRVGELASLGGYLHVGDGHTAHGHGVGQCVHHWFSRRGAGGDRRLSGGVRGLVCAAGGGGEEGGVGDGG